MRLEAVSSKHFEDILRIAYEAFQSESAYCAPLARVHRDAFYAYVQPRVAASQGLVALEGDTVKGYLISDTRYPSGDRTVLAIPEWGCGCAGNDRADTMSRLFRAFAEGQKGRLRYEVRLYAHDQDLIWHYTLTQFHAVLEQCAAFAGADLPEDVLCRPLPKDELTARWPEVWSLLSRLIGHLRESPVFYPGDEFTQEVFRDFYLENETDVFVSERDGRFVGLIETNAGDNDPFTRLPGCRNIGDIFVEPALRGQGVARALYRFASHYEQARGAKLLWVEHGTANPEARQFWNRYLTPYVYQFSRDVDNL